MIYVFFGDDRVKTQREIEKTLGEKYEVVEGKELDLNALRDIFFGASIFGARKIVIKDMAGNEAFYEHVEDFVGTGHEVVVWEEKFTKTTKLYKNLIKNEKITVQEFKVPEAKEDRFLAFNIYDTATRDGARAVKMLEPIEAKEAPQKIIGAWTYKATQNYLQRRGVKEKRVLVELSKLDMQLKRDSAISDPWTLAKGFLLRLSSM